MKINTILLCALPLCICGYVGWYYWSRDALSADLREKGFFVVGYMQTVHFPPNLPHSEVAVALQRIGSISSPKRLVLNENHVDGSIADRIARFESLRTLDLSGTGTTDDVLRKFSHLSDLRIVLLDWTDVSDASIPVILSMRRLEAVSVRHTRISADGVGKLRASIGVVHSD